MISITLPAIEEWDEGNECFIVADETTLRLEHSLVSIAEWESKWNKAFLSKREKTTEEVIDYIRCMILNEDIDEFVMNRFTSDDMKKIEEYIDKPMTAIKFPKENDKPNNETVTHELVYYWMSSLQIPFECEKWHFNKLINLIRVTSIKNTPPKKRSSKTLASDYAQMNRANRARLNSKG